MSKLMTDVLEGEYETLVAEVGKDSGDERIGTALVRDADWTEARAREVLRLARMYGTSIGGNALAGALGIEDGRRGM